MTPQTIFQLLLLAGVLMTAIGGYGSYHFGKIEQNEKDKISDTKQNELRNQVTDLQGKLNDVHLNTSQMAEQIQLIYQASKIEEDIWTDVEMKRVPPVDYMLLLFASNKGRITGKLKVKGSNEITTFSTTANNHIPVALRNLWVPKQKQYKTPTIIQFSITEKTEPNSELSIYTQGFIDSRDTEPH